MSLKRRDNCRRTQWIDETILDKQDVQDDVRHEPNSLNPKIPVSHASLAELMNWRNQNEVDFAWNDIKSLYWVIPSDESKVSPAIAIALAEHQDFLKQLCPPRESTSMNEDQYSEQDLDFLKQLEELKDVSDSSDVLRQAVESLRSQSA